MPKLNSSKRNPVAAALPAFIENKLMGHEADSLAQRKNGKHLVLGKHRRSGPVLAFCAIKAKGKD